MDRLPKLTYNELLDLVITLVDEKVAQQQEIDDLREALDAFRVLDTMRAAASAVNARLADYNN